MREVKASPHQRVIILFRIRRVRQTEGVAQFMPESVNPAFRVLLCRVLADQSKQIVFGQTRDTRSAASLIARTVRVNYPVIMWVVESRAEKASSFRKAIIEAPVILVAA